MVKSSNFNHQKPQIHQTSELQTKPNHGLTKPLPTLPETGGPLVQNTDINAWARPKQGKPRPSVLCADCPFALATWSFDYCRECLGSNRHIDVPYYYAQIYFLKKKFIFFFYSLCLYSSFCEIIYTATYSLKSGNLSIYLRFQFGVVFSDFGKLVSVATQSIVRYRIFGILRTYFQSNSHSFVSKLIFFGLIMIDFSFICLADLPLLISNGKPMTASFLGTYQLLQRTVYSFVVCQCAIFLYALTA